MSDNWFVARFNRIADERGSLERAAKAGTFKSLGQAAGAIRKTASRSIRRSKKHSRPGSAPNTQTGLLRRAIRYDLSKDKNDVAIGPVNEFAKTIWDTLEFGGKTRPRKKLKVRKHQIGDYGPVAIAPGRNTSKTAKEWQKRNFVRIKLVSSKQAKRADDLIAAENEVRERLESQPRTIEARPFMGPALEKMKPRLPAFWRNSVS